MRLGSVPYLNARPLTWGLEDRLVLAHPSVLARQLHAGELDAALVPVMEALEHPQYEILDGVGICCDGEVKSVFMAHRKKIGELRTVHLDYRSKTSAALVQVVLRAGLGLTVNFLPLAPDQDPAGCEAVLLIGDQALDFARDHAAGGWSYLDLGQAWKEWTGLPFVFAAWVLRSGTWTDRDLRMLVAAKEEGRRHVAQICRSQNHLAPEEAEAYLTRYVHYDLLQEHRQALVRFASELVALKLLPFLPQLRFVTFPETPE